MNVRRSIALALAGITSLAAIAITVSAVAKEGDIITFEKLEYEIVKEISIKDLDIDEDEPLLVVRPAFDPVFYVDDCDPFLSISWYRMNQGTLHYDSEGKLVGTAFCERFWTECVDGVSKVKSEIVDADYCL